MRAAADYFAGLCKSCIAPQTSADLLAVVLADVSRRDGAIHDNQPLFRGCPKRSAESTVSGVVADGVGRGSEVITKRTATPKP